MTTSDLPGSPYLSHRQGHLWLEGVRLSDLAAQHGTPLFVYSKAAMLSALAAYQRGFAGRDGLRFGRGIAQLLQDTARPLGAAVGEQGGGLTQRGAPEIPLYAVAFDPVEKSGHLDEFGAHRDETVVDHGAAGWSGPFGTGGFLARGGQGRARESGTEAPSRGNFKVALGQGRRALSGRSPFPRETSRRPSR